VTAYTTIAVLFSKFIVLLVRVCVSSKSTNVASDTAVLNCAKVPVKVACDKLTVRVLLALFIVLFVKVCEPVRVATVLSIPKVILLVPVAVSIPVPPSKSNVLYLNL